VTFEGALQLVTDACGESDGREMARRVGFMIASGNTDAHLKNWSLVWGDRPRPTLSPCYDLVATISWPLLGWQRRGGPELALPLGGQFLFGELGKAALENFSNGSYEWAGEEVRTGIERARDAWREVGGEVPERMRAALTKHWRAVPLLVGMGPLSR
jgi:serine/threonine-protein kinase HipA